MPNITFKSCYYLFILLHEKYFVTPAVFIFVTRILIDSVQHVILCDPKSKLSTRSIANTCKERTPYLIKV